MHTLSVIISYVLIFLLGGLIHSIRSCYIVSNCELKWLNALADTIDKYEGKPFYGELCTLFCDVCDLQDKRSNKSNSNKI